MALKTLTTDRLLIDGESVATAQTRTLVNPATGAPAETVPEGSVEDVQRAVKAAKTAFDDGRWSRIGPSARSAVLYKLADLIEEHLDELAALESRNVGKPIKLAHDSDLPFTVDCLRYFAGAARQLDGRASNEYVPGYASVIRREPIGVVGQLAPWNYPLMMAIWKIAPALAVGNVVVLKPSEITPLSTLRLAELAADILPPGVLNVITGCGHPVGAGIVTHPDVRMVSLTGSVATGKWIARAAADSLKRVHLELGGKAPAIVFDDADPAEVAAGLQVASFLNSGQDCTAAARVIVTTGAYEALLEELVPAAASLHVGDPAEGEAVEMGPVVSAVQQQRVLGFLDRATSAGAHVLIGGSAGRETGFFVEPTVVTGAAQDAEIIQSEVFGPVVTVQRVDSAEEAIGYANDVRYGLAASVWTRDVRTAMQAIKALDFGSVWVNDHLPFLSEMPHGGFKESGYGKDLSVYSLDDYTRVKHAMIKLE